MKLPRLCLLVQMLAACSPAPDDSFFPLEKGHRWTYDVRTEREGALEHETRVLDTLGTDTLTGAESFRRHSDSGVDYWLRRDASGVYRVAAKSDLDAEPRPDKEHRYVLKAPFTVGSTWRAGTTAYLLQRRQEFPREIRHSHPDIPMTYTIEAIGETVSVRAGRYDGCLRVKGVAVLKLFADPVSGWRDLPLTTTEWYCRGVGLVKLERDEPAGSAFLSGGKLTMELVDWR